MERQVEIVRIENIATGGDGVARLEDGRVVFVPRTVPGDHAEIEIVRSKKTYAHGRLREVRQPGAGRTASECLHFERCGGCQFWQMEYATELTSKTQAAHETIARISKRTLPTPQVHGAPTTRAYRTRATFHVRTHRGKVRIGFFAPQSNRVVTIERCAVLEPILMRCIRRLGELFEPGDELEVFVETAGDGQAVATVKTSESTARATPLARRMAELEEPWIRGLVLETREERIVFGDPTIDAGEALPDAPANFRVPAGAFRQANQNLNRTLVELVRERAGDGGRLLELFSGMGNFTLALAPSFDTVEAFEGDREAVETGAAMAELSNLEHVRFEAVDLEQGLEGELDADVVLLDPPRSGADALCRQLAQTSARRIVYVSCDPACLGRDLRHFDDATWRVTSVDMLDMFPRTAHLETVVVLERIAPENETGEI